MGSLADVAAMSRSAFAERFTAVFGRPPMALVKDVRMRRAAGLLRADPTLSVDEVASRVGFSSRSHFSRSFEACYGAPPADFRTPAE